MFGNETRGTRDLNITSQALEECTPVNGQGRLVLLVEDNEKNARLMAAMLDSAGYRTCLATDGSEGARLAKELLPALIITDLQMPGVDGLQMARALKGREETRHIPIIAVSAHALKEHRQEALAAGCCRFLTKPFRYRTLLSETADALRIDVTAQ
jgi:two-component system cell cycle response regulator DivK